ncbi:MAG: hypothetical protein GY768_12485 [Planctomycetaceae bacterium]|nr:hypothetical protein [Planctomycetaceae bacterium]
MNQSRSRWWTGVSAVFEFEIRQALTAAGIAWWCILTFFPVAIVSLVLLSPNARRNVPTTAWQVFFFVLVPFLISMLGTFKWTASAISSELEGQSWVYLAVRPNGRVAVSLGKYLAAVIWTLAATLIGITLAVFVAWIANTTLSNSGEIWRTWFAIARLCCLSVPAYAAVYLTLGTIFTKRSMVIVVAYTLIFEVLVSFVPALINKFTIQYRLRALFVQWTGIELSATNNEFGWMDIVGEEPAWIHLTALISYVAVLVLFACCLVRKREYLVTSSADIS